jgi:hypothetical protein
MGIAVRASLGGRATAASLVARAVDDDARQDECHARDSDQVRPVRRHEGLVRVVVGRAEVDDDVHEATHDHQRQAEDHRQRKASERFYHEHELEIHRRPRAVKSIAQNDM